MLSGFPLPLALFLMVESGTLSMIMISAITLAYPQPSLVCLNGESVLSLIETCIFFFSFNCCTPSHFCLDFVEN